MARNRIKFMLISMMIGLLPTMVHSANIGWYYGKLVDEMTSKDLIIANLKSENSINLPFPYSGENHGLLQVRRDPQYGLMVFVRAGKGQVLCQPSHSCSLLVRFDDRAAVTFRGALSADGSTTDVIVNETNKFIASASKATTIKIQIPFYKAGDQVFTFNGLKPLKWPAPDMSAMNSLVKGKIKSGSVKLGGESVDVNNQFCGWYSLQSGDAPEGRKRFIVQPNEYIDIEGVTFESLGSTDWEKVVSLQKMVAKVKAAEGIKEADLNLLAFHGRWIRNCAERYKG